MSVPLEIPEKIQNEEDLDEFLSRPSPDLVKMMERLEGDLIILGIGGKMGSTLGRLAVRAFEITGSKQKVLGVSRFSDMVARNYLEDYGVETIQCNLLDPKAVARLPLSRNVIFMVGKKFGSQ